MARERWIVEGKLRGEFAISDQQLSAASEPGQRVKRLEVTPEFDDCDKYTGLHLLTIDLDLENETSLPMPADVAFSEAKEVAERIASVISLSTGRPVLVEGVSVKHRLSENPPKYRVVIGQAQAVAIAPPSAFDPALLTMNLDRKTRRVVRWWARGIAADDGVDSLAALTTALDILAGMQEGVPGRTRTCSKCGHHEQMGPGLRDRVVAFLTLQLGYEEQTAIDIYESRIDLAHGRSDLGEEDLRRFRIHSKLVADAVRDGLGKRLGVELPPTPQKLPFDLPSALLDIEYIEPPPEQTS